MAVEVALPKKVKDEELELLGAATVALRMSLMRLEATERMDETGAAVVAADTTEETADVTDGRRAAPVPRGTEVAAAWVLLAEVDMAALLEMADGQAVPRLLLVIDAM